MRITLTPHQHHTHKKCKEYTQSGLLVHDNDLHLQDNEVHPERNEIVAFTTIVYTTTDETHPKPNDMETNFKVF